MVAKFSLKSIKEVKELQAMCFCIILVPLDCEFVSIGKDAIMVYANQICGKGGKYDLGEPYIYLWLWG